MSTQTIAKLPRLLLVSAIATALPLEAAYAQLEEVFVTAERREASVQDVPLAVSAFNEQMIDQLQIDDTLDLINIVPNLFGGNNTGLGTANMYYMRAQGNDESVATFDPPVGTYVDDVYITRQNANNFTLFDVERLEVLRGPQGTLYGRNTTGGAISVIMRKPGEEMSGYLEAGVGRWDRTMIRGSVDLPVNDRVLTKSSYYSVDDDGYLNNTVDGKTYNAVDSTGWRAAFRFLLTDTVTWDVSVDGGDTQAANIHGFLDGDRRVSGSNITSGLPAGLVQKADYGNQVDMLNIVSNLAWEVGGGTANFIVGSREIEQDFLINFPVAPTIPDFFVIDNLGEHDMFSAELKWAGNIMDDRVFLTGGIYYMDEKNTTDWRSYLDLAGVGVPVPPSVAFLTLADRIMDNTTESLAIYAQADIKIGESGTLTVGARYTDEEKDVALVGSVTSEQIAAAGVPLEQSESKVTPRLAYSHAINDDMMAYVSATNGFKSGGWNARATVGSEFLPFGPESIWAYEAGLRADWLDGRLRTNLTAFYSDLDDLQTTAAVNGIFTTTNAGGLEVTGFEAEITALPTENWQIFATLGLQDAKYVDLPSGCSVPNTSFAAYDVDCNAATPKRSPDETFTLGTFVDFTVGELVLTPSVMVRYIGENVTGTRNAGPNDSTTIYNLGLRVSMATNDLWELNLECKNCGDETFTQSNLFIPYYNLPETWMASVKFRFGNR